MEDFELDLDDLGKILNKNIKDDIKSFEDLVNLDGSLAREIYLYDIEAGTGSTIDGYIRFWNSYDNKHNIPIEERKPIKIYIDSNGGYLTDTFTIVDSIKASKTPIWTICIGCAYSGGFFSFICGHKRFAYPHSSFLFHEGSTQTGGTSSQFENYTSFYKRQLNQLKSIVLENTDITEEEYDKIRREDIWYDTKDGVQKGFIDEIVGDFV
jgi:ATP-dependent Clp protease protease subunit